MFRAHADRLSYQTRSTVINRKDYGITLNAALETGAVLVSDKHP
jgi:polyisoprenoid-binding protein YceI